MKQTLSDAQINELQTYSEGIVEGLCEADEDFEARRKILDYLGVKVTFSIEDETEVALIECHFGYQARRKRANRNLSRRRGSARLANSREAEEGSYMSVDMHSTDCTHN